MTTVHDIANYLAAKAEQADGEYHNTSNFKLQKLVYYIQGFHLALHGSPAFDEVIEAWPHGPVVPELYRDLKKYGKGTVPAERPLSEIAMDKRLASLIDSVFLQYGKFSGWQLASLTHQELPWIVYSPARNLSREIPQGYIKAYFSSLQ